MNVLFAVCATPPLVILAPQRYKYRPSFFPPAVLSFLNPFSFHILLSFFFHSFSASLSTSFLGLETNLYIYIRSTTRLTIQLVFASGISQPSRSSRPNPLSIPSLLPSYPGTEKAKEAGLKLKDLHLSSKEKDLAATEI
jgi:hypothetical protein